MKFTTNFTTLLQFIILIFVLCNASQNNKDNWKRKREEEETGRKFKSLSEKYKYHYPEKYKHKQLQRQRNDNHCDQLINPKNIQKTKSSNYFYKDANMKDKKRKEIILVKNKMENKNTEGNKKWEEKYKKSRIIDEDDLPEPKKIVKNEGLESIYNDTYQLSNAFADFLTDEDIPKEKSESLEKYAYTQKNENEFDQLEKTPKRKSYRVETMKEHPELNEMTNVLHEEEKAFIGMRGTLYYKGKNKTKIDLDFVVQYIDHDAKKRKYLISYPEEDEFPCEWVDLDFKKMIYIGDDESGVVKEKFEIDESNYLQKQQIIKPIITTKEKVDLSIENSVETEEELIDSSNVLPWPWKELENRIFFFKNTNHFAAIGVLREAVLAEHKALVKYLCKKGWEDLQDKRINEEESDLEMLTSCLKTVDIRSDNPLHVGIKLNKTEKEISKSLMYDNYFLKTFKNYCDY